MGHGRERTATRGGDDVVVTVSRLHVAAMDCAAEEQLVLMALSDLDVVHRAEVDLDARTVTVDHDTSAEALGAALRPLGLGATHLDDDRSEIGPAPDSRRERNALTVALAPQPPGSGNSHAPAATSSSRWR